MIVETGRAAVWQHAKEAGISMISGRSQSISISKIYQLFLVGSSPIYTSARGSAREEQCQRERRQTRRRCSST
ncbi:hypothetical protein [Klebsiella phage vB_KshKPC-M]|nr:hypothetical protein [Klebsiella phage vB_KshKPC-M]